MRMKAVAKTVLLCEISVNSTKTFPISERSFVRVISFFMKTY